MNQDIGETNYNRWNKVKINLSSDKKVRLFKERDIFFIKMGHNIGYEQNGKGDDFVRPIVVLKKITKDMFIGVPLSTKVKGGSWFFKFSFTRHEKEIQNVAILPQIRMFSSKRLLNKIGVIPSESFKNLKIEIKEFML